MMNIRIVMLHIIKYRGIMKYDIFLWKELKLILSALLVIILVSCNKRNSTESIEGLWISTEETSAKFLHGTQKTVLRISKDYDGRYTARGVFLWNSSYQSEWNLVDLEYDHMTDSIIINDTDGDSYKGMVDCKNMKITGAVHLRNNIQDTLDFIPAEKDLEAELFYPRKPDKNGEIIYTYKVPEHLDDGLETASISNSDLDSASIIALVNDIINQEYGRMESLLVLKDNKLIVEEYFYSYDRGRLHHIHSCTKSITSLLLGIALEQHKDIQVDQPLFSFFPEYASLETNEKEQITLEHCLTMTAGFQWDEFPKEMYETDDWFQYILSRPMNSIPGDVFHYNSGCTILLGGVISLLVGKNADLYAEEVLFGPLGISEYIWETHRNGTPQCGGGLQMLPRDMAKIGLLLLNDGRWNNKQIVSKEWILQSTKPRVPESEFLDYGYQWWHRSKNNKKWWEEPQTVSEEEHDMSLALGWGGQYIIVAKDLNLVVITTASDYKNDKANSKIPMVIEEIIPK